MQHNIGNEGVSTNREATLQILIFGRKDPSKPRCGQPKLTLCFAGTGKRISKDEKAQYHPGVFVQFQRRAWYDQQLCMRWAAEVAPFLMSDSADCLVFCDNLSGQTTKEFAACLKTKCNAAVHCYVAGQTDEISGIDAGFGALVKTEFQEVLDEWISDPERPQNWEEWSSARIPASRKRVLMTHWYADAYDRACAKFDFVRVFTSVGHHLTVDGSHDEMIKLQGCSSFTFTDADAGRDPKTGAMPEITDLTTPSQPIPANHGRLQEQSQAVEGSSDDDSDRESFSANGNSTTTEEGDSTECDVDVGDWGNSSETSYFSDCPEWALASGALVGYRVVQKFNDGWSIGVVKGTERDKRKCEFGQYFVKHKSDRYPFYDELSAAYYGKGKAWVLLKQKKQANPSKRAKR